MIPTYEYIVAGAGCAGLGLVWQMIRSGMTDTKILILDPDSKTQNDRTWSFWSESPVDLPCQPHKTWNRLLLADIEAELQLNIAPYIYYTYRAADYYESIKREISLYNNITWKFESVLAFESCPEGVTVTTPVEKYTAKWAFNSTGLLQKPVKNQSEYQLQHFHGWVVQTSEPVFNPDQATLMDFRVTPGDEVRFLYTLPVSAHEALIEITVFSSHVWSKEKYLPFLEKQVQALKILGAGNIQVLEEETGVIPMNTTLPPAWKQARVMNLGLQGGAARPGTGYAFLGIQMRNKAIVESILTHGFPVSPPVHKARHLFYDALLLRIIRHSPEKISTIFMQLFKQVNTSRVLRFLSEESSLIDDLLIFVRLPWKPFLKVLWSKLIENKEQTSPRAPFPTTTLPSYAHKQS